MWTLTLHSPSSEPHEYILKQGRTTVGRKTDNDIVISDESASRLHAEIRYRADENTLVLQDLDSTNGTFVNRERVTQPRPLRPDDEIRIGQHVLSVSYRETKPIGTPPDALSGTRPFTRDLLLESLDRHAVLLYEAAQRLNTVLDLDTALREVATLMRRSMGADKGEVILADRFDRLHELGFPTSIARQAIEQRAAVIIPDVSAQPESRVGQSALLLRIRSALCVPVMIGQEVVGLVYVYKTSPLSRPFDRRDLQIAVALSHQASLTIQRTRLLRRIRQEQRIREFLQRFLPAHEAEFLVQDYLKTSRLPELAERTLTIVFADMRASTVLAERLGARRFSEILGRYYQDMTEAVFQHGGLMHQYVGDGLMAVFGMYNRSTPEERAARAALAMLERLATLNRAENEHIEIGVGLNTGPAMAGYLDLNDRIEFTVLGDTVNVAEGLQAQARPNRIFIGPSTYEALNGHFNIRPVGPVELKGRAQPVEVHEVLPGPE